MTYHGNKKKKTSVKVKELSTKQFLIKKSEKTGPSFILIFPSWIFFDIVNILSRVLKYNYCCLKNKKKKKFFNNLTLAN